MFSIIIKIRCFTIYDCYWKKVVVKLEKSLKIDFLLSMLCNLKKNYEKPSKNLFPILTLTRYFFAASKHLLACFDEVIGKSFI